MVARGRLMWRCGALHSRSIHDWHEQDVDAGKGAEDLQAVGQWGVRAARMREASAEDIWQRRA